MAPGDSYRSGTREAATCDLQVPDKPPIPTSTGGAGRIIRHASAKYFLALDRAASRSGLLAIAALAAVTLARIAARNDMKNGNAAIASRSDMRRVSAR